MGVISFIALDWILSEGELDFFFFKLYTIVLVGFYLKSKPLKHR